MEGIIKEELPVYSIKGISHIFGHGKFNKYIYFPKEFNASYQSLKL
jgi:hypothetical protein